MLHFGVVAVRTGELWFWMSIGLTATTQCNYMTETASWESDSFMQRTELSFRIRCAISYIGVRETWRGLPFGTKLLAGLRPLALFTPL